MITSSEKGLLFSTVQIVNVGGVGVGIHAPPHDVLVMQVIDGVQVLPVPPGELFPTAQGVWVISVGVLRCRLRRRGRPTCMSWSG